MLITEEEVIPILKELIKIKTENPPGRTIDAVNFLAKVFEESNIECTIQEYEEGKANIIAEYGDGENTIILTGHLDTVPAGDEEKWKHPPFSAYEEDGKIYGRGATDMKGAVAAYVALMKYLSKHKIQLNKKVVFLGTSDEEIGMDGAVAAKEIGIMNNCDFIVIGEPTELKVGIAEKGTLWIKIKVEGKPAHGSTPQLGISAIEAAARLIPKMKEAIPELEHKMLGKSTLNIGEIKGGTVINVVPELCEFKCDYRLVADKLRDATKNKIDELIDAFNEAEEAKASIEIIHEIPAIETTEESEFFNILKKKVKEMGIEEIIGVNYGTDGAMLVPEYETPFIIIGPGKLDQLHVTDEYTEKEEVIIYSNIVLDAILESFSVQ